MGIISSKLNISRTIILSLLAPICLLSVSFSSDKSANFKDTLYDPIEHIVTNAIKEQQFPGCQILVVKDGKPIMNRAYGHLTYDSLTEVTSESIYDVASLTKVMATSLMILDLKEKNQIRLDEPISCYMDEFVGTNKEAITIRQLLTHNAGLRSYLPLWEQTFQSSLCEDLINGGSFDINNPALKDSLNFWIRDSELGTFRGRSRYRYSDVGFMILHQLGERVSGVSMEEYLTEKFYQPLQLSNTYFNPLKKGISQSKIAPTEWDFLMRYNQVWGEVHDRNAWLFGGVAGHAGLFSNAEDLAELTNLFLEKNEGEEIGFSDELIEEATSPHFNRNRRGLGWDRKHSRVSEYVSESSFGHKGFTGTMVWADPEHDLVFVFLSNRVYPNAENWKLISRKTRSRIQDVVYEALVLVYDSNKEEVE